MLSTTNTEKKQVSAEDKTKAEKKEEKNRVVVSVTGMSCTTCALAIEKQVKKVRGVNDVRTAIMLNKVFIDYDPNLVDSTIIRKAIDKTGYKSYITVEEKQQSSH